MELEKQILASSAQWTETINPQTLWLKFKNELVDKCRQRSKVMVPKIKTHIWKLQACLDSTLCGLQEDPTEEDILTTALLQQKKIDELT